MLQTYLSEARKSSLNVYCLHQAVEKYPDQPGLHLVVFGVSCNVAIVDSSLHTTLKLSQGEGTNYVVTSLRKGQGEDTNFAGWVAANR